MKYTILFGHLKGLPEYKVGQELRRGDAVGVMGNTGKSHGAHVHFVVVKGHYRKIIHLVDIMAGEFQPSVEQANKFCDDELMAHPLIITTYYCEPAYQKKYKLLHYGYDVVPSDANSSFEHWIIYWNRWGKKIGTVSKIGTDKSLGNYVCITYED